MMNSNMLENGVTFGIDTKRIYWDEKRDTQYSISFYVDFDEVYLYEEYSGDTLTIPDEGYTEITYRDGVRFVVSIGYSEFTELYKPFKGYVITKTLEK